MLAGQHVEYIPLIYEVELCSMARKVDCLNEFHEGTVQEKAGDLS